MTSRFRIQHILVPALSIVAITGAPSDADAGKWKNRVQHPIASFKISRLISSSRVASAARGNDFTRVEPEHRFETDVLRPPKINGKPVVGMRSLLREVVAQVHDNPMWRPASSIKVGKRGADGTATADFFGAEGQHLGSITFRRTNGTDHKWKQVDQVEIRPNGGTSYVATARTPADHYPSPRLVRADARVEVATPDGIELVRSEFVREGILSGGFGSGHLRVDRPGEKSLEISYSSLPGGQYARTDSRSIGAVVPAPKD